MDDLSNIRMFLSVARLGSFSEAARQLNLAPSSVSRQITQLEDSLGVRLFTRTTRTLTLTGHRPAEEEAELMEHFQINVDDEETIED